MEKSKRIGIGLIILGLIYWITDGIFHAVKNIQVCSGLGGKIAGLLALLSIFVGFGLLIFKKNTENKPRFYRFARIVVLINLLFYGIGTLAISAKIDQSFLLILGLFLIFGVLLALLILISNKILKYIVWLSLIIGLISLIEIIYLAAIMSA